MISDLTSTPSGGAIVPRGTSADTLLRTAMVKAGTVQPIANVAEYRLTRTPQPVIDGEEHLLITLPAELQAEVKALVRACKYVADLVKQKCSVQAACVSALEVYKKWNWKLNTFRPKYDLWSEKRDWVVLVNMAKAPAAWKSTVRTLPENFLAHCEVKLGQFAREDGKRQALLAIHRHWRTGRDEDGEPVAIPGYEQGWSKRDRENLPVGWSYDNILRQMKNRARATKAVLKMLHIGESAARELLPQMLGSRKGLRFLEKITFDDVRMDRLVFNPATGQAEELWLLVARDESTAMVLGFVMHPATVREDGTAQHLNARHMKELAAYILERYPLPPYTVHWIVERGTATLAEAVKVALGELFNYRIKVHYTSMIGTKSPVGYKEKAKGNSRGKASHEAHNRLFHTQGCHIQGQTGANWGIRPADLDARVKECRQIHEMAQRLPEDKRGEVKYSLSTLAQARVEFEKICFDQNNRHEHNLEGFDEVVEIWTGERWEIAQSAMPGERCRTRMEKPYERAARLIRSVERWDKIDPSIIITFLEHTQRIEVVENNGEIKLMHEGKTLYFRHVDQPLPPGTKCLAYHHPEEPEFLHLTTGDGRILGTWVQRGRGMFLDQKAMAEGLRYTHAAREAAKAVANELAKPQRDKLDAMREHNAELEKFVVITDAPGANGRMESGGVAGSLQAIKSAGDDMKVNPPAIQPIADCTEEVLAREESAPKINFD